MPATPPRRRAGRRSPATGRLRRVAVATALTGLVVAPFLLRLAGPADAEPSPAASSTAAAAAPAGPAPEPVPTVAPLPTSVPTHPAPVPVPLPTLRVPGTATAPAPAAPSPTATGTGRAAPRRTATAAPAPAAPAAPRRVPTTSSAADRAALPAGVRRFGDSATTTTTAAAGAAAPSVPSAAAASVPSAAAPATPAEPGATTGPSASPSGSALKLTGIGGSPLDSPVSLVLLLGAITFIPALLIMTTAFTRVVIVLGFVRSALGTNGIPPNQVVIGLSLFLSLFVMAPTFSQANHDALQPLTHGQITQTVALERAVVPFRQFMLKQVREEDLSMFVKLAGDERPAKPADVPTTTLVPAFLLSELRTAFLIGFVIFIPFIIIDLVVSAALSAMGMVMLPPALISLPFKLLLFVAANGWALVVDSLVSSFHH